jgi:cystathionine beta-lyase/cystathionine gamma-synthase
MNILKGKSINTRAVHAGERMPKGEYGPVVTPLQLSVGFVYDSMEDMDAVFAGTHPGYVYPRYGSPTVAAFETAMAEMEQGQAALAFASGMAAIHGALLSAGVRAGSTIVAALDIYGATYTLLQQFFAVLGVAVRWVDSNNHESVVAALEVTPAPDVLLVETISNPLLKVADVPVLSELAHRYGAQLLVDNTFASPYLFNPLGHGADYSIHSATKYIGGHCDVMAGVVVSSADNRERLFETNKLVGGVLGPFEAWLALRGIKTLPLRMRQHCTNAAEIANWLNQRPEIARVNYPGLGDHPQYELAGKLFEGRGYGGVLSFEIAGADRQRAFRFMEGLKLCQPATTLGDVYSLVLHPATSSHRSLSAEERKQVGISDGLVRLSVGIEDAADIIVDLEGALKN